MILGRELFHPDGFLLLSRGFVVDERVVERLTQLEKNQGIPLWVPIEVGNEDE